MSKYGFDKFYTKKNLAKKLIDTLDINKYNTIIEPSAGNGSFSSQIKNCIAFDIEPEASNIIKQDFLTLDKNFQPPILVIGNPPFGRNSSLALAFIKKSSLFADTIAFILPKSFKKESLYNKIPLNFWIENEIDLEDDSFYFNGDIVKIPCVFQVYIKKDIKREKSEKLKPKNFSFVKKEYAKLSVRRVGVNAGKASLDTNKSKQSHYFIDTDNPEKLVKKINELKWAHNNTVGPRSISKNELIKAIAEKS